ncbi:uncharacterized protein KGF55_002432 [Candida pseudojiufengensis]|uniref:uncharacterized protein n=1 Tax=Candida pseudojiufengensis TaxID=497109 RepID=UPI00222403BD|nr:uncharacterized protein KGF55_002432 [Candida pseudojiufengensis]KAI5963552.1 hypothetical protein KGF55_002432 [Candida pseudojiufengensis]
MGSTFIKNQHLKTNEHNKLDVEGLDDLFQSNSPTKSISTSNDGILQDLHDDQSGDNVPNNNKMDFQKLSQFIKEAYDKKPTTKFNKSNINFQDDEFDIDSILSNYKKDQNSYLKEMIPSFNNRITIHSINLELRDKLYNKCEIALIPTLQKINEMNSSLKIYEFYSNLLNNLQEEIKNSKNGKLNNRFYLSDLFLKTNQIEWNNLHDEVINKIQAKSIESPLNPELNLISLPIITNHIFQKLGFKLFNANLIQTFLNFIQKDFYLFSLCFNQETFNLILKINWIYFGNLDLLNIEKILNEMKFFGFNGDFKTFQILKIIIDEYNLLSNGNSIFNKFGCKILTKDDNLRIKYLTKEFYKLKNRLNEQLIKKDEELLESLI